MSLLARALVGAIRAYQRRGGGDRMLVECNFEPSCSEYAARAVERHGAVRGVVLGVRRVRRCTERDAMTKVVDPVPITASGPVPSRDLVDQEQERIRSLVRGLSPADREAFYRTVTRRIRDPDTYAVLSFAWVVGLHHFYLGRWLRGCLDVVGLAVGVALLIGGSLIGLVPLLTVGLLELAALVRSQTIVKDYNNRVALQALAELSAHPGPSPGS